MDRTKSWQTATDPRMRNRHVPVGDTPCHMPASQSQRGSRWTTGKHARGGEGERRTTTVHNHKTQGTRRKTHREHPGKTARSPKVGTHRNLKCAAGRLQRTLYGAEAVRGFPNAVTTASRRLSRVLRTPSALDWKRTADHQVCADV